VFVTNALACVASGCSRREQSAPPTPKESSSTTTLSGALAASPAAAVTPEAAKDAAASLPTPRSLAGKKVLHVGDSMVGGTFGLTRALSAKLAEEGAKVVRHTTVSETLASFDKTPTLKDLIRTHDPDIIVITLGTNDAIVPHPEVYAHNVENIVRRVRDRECWWIGPPSWKGPDTGIVSVIRDHAGSCRFFDSSKLELDRTSDGIHPSDRGAAKWADAFWQVFRAPEPTSP
jgi:lysophospholipase L1-like esterase